MVALWRAGRLQLEPLVDEVVGLERINEAVRAPDRRHGGSGDARAVITVPGMNNIRDLGGLPAADGRELARGRFLRSEALAMPGAASAYSIWDEAHATDYEALRLRTVIDLRSDGEVDATPSAWARATGADVVRLPIAEGVEGTDTDYVNRLIAGTLRALRRRGPDRVLHRHARAPGGRLRRGDPSARRSRPAPPARALLGGQGPHRAARRARPHRAGNAAGRRGPTTRSPASCARTGSPTTRRCCRPASTSTPSACCSRPPPRRCMTRSRTSTPSTAARRACCSVPAAWPENDLVALRRALLVRILRSMSREVIALVKHDCPVCDQVLPALDAAGVRLVSQSSPDETAAQAARLGLSRVPEHRRGPAALGPARPGGGAGRDRARGRRGARPRRGPAARPDRGAHRARCSTGCRRCGPGCASRTRDPDVAPRLAARRARATGRIVSRELEIGDLEDPFEALHARGLDRRAAGRAADTGAGGGAARAHVAAPAGPGRRRAAVRRARRPSRRWRSTP